MSSALAEAPAAVGPATAGAAGPADLLSSVRFEWVKLVSQWRVRIVLLACWLGPAIFIAIASQQSSLPSDTVFGRWMSATGWAGSLVVLGFSCSWVLPLITALVAGDVFAAEDRLGTWRHLVMAVRSPRRIFVAKALASTAVILVMEAGLAASSILGGVAAVGNHALVGLDGTVIDPGQAARSVLLSWACVVAASLAYAAVGLLGSVALGRSPMGLLVPALLAFGLQSAQLLPMPATVRLALPSQTFLAWRGLFTSPAQPGPLLVGLSVSLAWVVVATTLAYLLFVRRDFAGLTYDGAGLRLLLVGAVPLAVLTGASIAVVGAATPATGSGIQRPKVEQSVATSFAHLYRLQARELHRPDVTEEQLRTSASCYRAGSHGNDAGPGNDWRCVVSWHIPGATAVGTAIYQLDVAAEGRYVADGDGPREVNGYFQVHTPTGDAPNPLWQVDGLVDLSRTPSKG
ncbi:ABC-2 type transport system permease protein [Phycicoccus badiiscoriae]|uniref:ABC-2 type transport system permease protein n=1 Tax=Pedococcus badiiscoriae TaxID=642776 RepID=A0A852WKR6_9MICO|nr:ABC transporter permease [Pedococcus badiiscoriae]NYG08211.1 ABC-2 type transport system permease protein [Pedococcus badiiscoriae]